MLSKLDTVAEFDSPRRKLKQAKRHLNRVNELVSEYVATAKTSVTLEQIAGRHLWLHVLKVTPNIPDEIHATLADANQNMRDALDQAASSCARCCGKSDNGVWFPFGNTEPEFQAAIKEKMRKLPQRVREYVSTLNAYPTGNDLLWELHSTNIANKHRRTFKIGLTSKEGRATIRLGHFAYQLLNDPAWRETDSTLAYAISDFPHQNYELQLKPEVRLDTSGDFGSAPATEILSAVLSVTNEIIEELQALMLIELGHRTHP